MASFEFLAIIISVLGLAASITYYAIILNNTNKTQRMQLETRQTQLFMDIYKIMANKEFMKDLEQIIIYWEYSDYDDFYAKYGADVNPEDHAKLDFLLQYYQGIALLVSQGLIDSEVVYKLMRYSIIGFWEKYRHIVEVDRVRFETPTLYEDVEELYNILVQHRDKEIKQQT